MKFLVILSVLGCALGQLRTPVENLSARQPVPIEQVREDTNHPTKNVQPVVQAQPVSNVGIPTQNVVRSQTIVQQPVVNPIQYQRTVIQVPQPASQTVYRSYVHQVPVVYRYVQSIPVQNVPVQHVPVQSYPTIPVNLIRSQTFVSPVVKHRNVNPVQQIVQVPQPVAQPVGQPVEQPVQNVQPVQQSAQPPVLIDQKNEAPVQEQVAQPQQVSVAQPMANQPVEQFQYQFQPQPQQFGQYQPQPQPIEQIQPQPQSQTIWQVQPQQIEQVQPQPQSQPIEQVQPQPQPIEQVQPTDQVQPAVQPVVQPEAGQPIVDGRNDNVMPPASLIPPQNEPNQESVPNNNNNQEQPAN